MRHFLALLAFAGLFSPLSALAQDSLHISAPVKLTVGISMGGTSAGIGVSTDITARADQKMLQARLLRTTSGLASTNTRPQTFTELWGTAFTGGLRREFANGWLIGRARMGLSTVFEVKGVARQIFSADDARYRRERTVHAINTAIGIPAEVELIFIPVRYMGLGVHAAGNLNRVHPFAGLFFTIRLGHFQ